MDSFYLITNRVKDPDLTVTEKVKKYIESKGKTCHPAKEGEPVPGGTECILVLGGDGTLIHAARKYRSYGIPLMGINLGTLGYLTEAEIMTAEKSLDRLVKDEIYVEERMMLKGVLDDGREDAALNDIVLSRCGAPHIVTFTIYVNGILLNTYHADGVILSTPTGSTAYNLSAGGPVVEPTASMIVITPICPHALAANSIVLSSDDEIVLEIGKGKEGGRQEAGLSFDGDSNIRLHTGDHVRICKADDTVKLLKLNKIGFLEVLQRKMKVN